MYEVLESVCVIYGGTVLASQLGLDDQLTVTKESAQNIHFITVGERGIVRIWKSEWYRLSLLQPFWNYYVLNGTKCALCLDKL